jgi:hypothetical protein
MKRKVAAGMLSAVAMAANAAGGVFVPHSLMTGSQYQQFSPAERQRYVAGVVDGFFFAPMLAATQVMRVYKLQACAVDHQMNDAVITAIVDKFVADNPEIGGEDMHYIVFRAMRGACAKLGNPID